MINLLYYSLNLEDMNKFYICNIFILQMVLCKVFDVYNFIHWKFNHYCLDIDQNYNDSNYYIVKMNFYYFNRRVMFSVYSFFKDFFRFFVYVDFKVDNYFVFFDLDRFFLLFFPVYQKKKWVYTSFKHLLFSKLYHITIYTLLLININFQVCLVHSVHIICFIFFIIWFYHSLQIGNLLDHHVYIDSFSLYINICYCCSFTVDPRSQTISVGVPELIIFFFNLEGIFDHSDMKRYLSTIREKIQFLNHLQNPIFFNSFIY